MRLQCSENRNPRSLRFQKDARNIVARLEDGVNFFMFHFLATKYHLKSNKALDWIWELEQLFRQIKRGPVFQDGRADSSRVGRIALRIFYLSVQTKPLSKTQKKDLL